MHNAAHTGAHRIRGTIGVKPSENMHNWPGADPLAPPPRLIVYVMWSLCAKKNKKELMGYAQTPLGRSAKSRWRTKNVDWNRAYIAERKLREGCSVCGYAKCANALQYHHVDANKFKSVSKLMTYGRAKIERELRKCILLCANCHAELHSKEGHGTRKIDANAWQLPLFG